ncbi:MAG TPA: MogA/MoaB family molybdenum cofactor biosynthesis protein [Thermoanaerobaculia bacterium]|nr:MogA/MoaB family molybdenum cofactor biosynthesis protein [Thermoanaerobaculia bacterium]
MSTEEHRESAAGLTAACAVLTVSDTRTAETDEGGRLLAAGLRGAGHRVVARALVRDEPAAVHARLVEWLGAAEAEVIVTTGGTGIARRDTTVEVAERLLDRRIDGFGELFRMLSFREVGAAAMLSRALAGLAGRTAVFVLPGSPAAVRLALDELILPELPHLLRELRR